MNSAIKRGAERVLATRAVAWAVRQRTRGKRLILAYHGIRPAGEPASGERALHLDQREFARQLDVLVELAEVVPLDDIDGAEGTRPRVAITFDDAYQGAVVHGVAELATRGLPATIFVAPGLLGSRALWWDALAHPAGELGDRERHHAIHGLQGDHAAVREWACRSGLRWTEELPSHTCCATAAELHGALAVPGIQVGSHSWSHANLAALSPELLAAELSRSGDWLRTECTGRRVSWLAYPYGLHSPRVEAATLAAGYEGALRIEGGWHRRADAGRFSRPRLNVPAGVTVDGFRARVSGALRA